MTSRAIRYLAWMMMLPTITLAQGRLLRDIAREHKAGDSIVLTVASGFEPSIVMDLIKNADLVIEALIDRSASLQTADGRSIETYLNVTVLRVLFHDASAIPVPTEGIRWLFVIHPGGEVDLDERKVIVDAGIPHLVVARRFVLFLKKMPNAEEGTFSLSGGAYGVFEVLGDRVVSLVASPERRIHEHDGVPIEAFGEMLRTLRHSSKEGSR